ncbi:unnamed protein product [Rotaria magnacalcarata]|uniref:Glutaminyl-peptide cyclotransferase n=4 Tax=Rotaria magnacalcarata TaxID=392030 RepID=A0A816A435_9BILA|nr:unnamed protein product [Rotaria magnacalcarata]CAF1590826.1 unnamed protein product [Rotaria magnacalcarata]CAF1960493.1 unnamed protein product [Rotaria magnacalcarata]CAF2057021.1 unnamed protein product [Rotaria magnacalcarata]CAF2107419.1 unnamed protein product [Rotaria magnacalcarata]
MSLSNVFSIIFISCLCYNIHLVQTRRAKHGVREISAKQYQCFSISENSNDFRTNLLRPLLIQRVSGTPGNARARQFILSKLQSLNMWDIELDTFDEKTPDGNVEFTNIIATLDPRATRRLVLACHYDSKKLPNFVGATDSAVPCAMLLDIAISLQNQLNQLKQNRGNPTLQLIFFDGEEAVRDWTKSDSLYGSRHLANKMRYTNVPGQQSLNQIDAMDMLILLDLIGDKSVQFQNFFDRTTGKYYNRLRDIESGLFRSYNNNAYKRTVFSADVRGSFIEDDHVPFLHLDVPILHLISVPFPSTWHRDTDNEANLDFPSITHLRNVMKIFVIEYLHLNPQIC